MSELADEPAVKPLTRFERVIEAGGILLLTFLVIFIVL